MSLFIDYILVLLRPCWYAAFAALMCTTVSILNRWRIFYANDEELAVAMEGLKTLILRGRKETELLLSGDYGRRVAMGYVFRDLSRFSEGESYLNAYFRRRSKVATEQAIAEWEDRRPGQYMQQAQPTRRK